MKASKTESRLETGFYQPKTGLPKRPVLTSLIQTTGTKCLCPQQSTCREQNDGNALHSWVCTAVSFLSQPRQTIHY